jgi:hypothetical protein
MAQLSFAELIERAVPMSVPEAVALTLAAAAALDCHAGSDPAIAPESDRLLLSSTGEVNFAEPRTGPTLDEQAWLSALLCQLLAIEERADRAGARGRARIPGGLLVLIARTRRQIDLPPLSSGAFRSALARFADAVEPSVLAAVFWRAARMRAKQTEVAVTASLTPSPRPRVDRRTQGPSASEVRRWLRQTELELFNARRVAPLRAARMVRRALRKGRRPATAAAVGGLLVLIGGLRMLPDRSRVLADPVPADVVVLDTNAPPIVHVGITTPTAPLVIDGSDPGDAPLVRMRTSPASSSTHAPSHKERNAASRRLRAKADRAVVPRPQRVNHRPQRTVRLVNLPRTPWVESQGPAQAGRR